jgi:hypothetical protein
LSACAAWRGRCSVGYKPGTAVNISYHVHNVSAFERDGGRRLSPGSLRAVPGESRGPGPDRLAPCCRARRRASTRGGRAHENNRDDASGNSSLRRPRASPALATLPRPAPPGRRPQRSGPGRPRGALPVGGSASSQGDLSRNHQRRVCSRSSTIVASRGVQGGLSSSRPPAVTGSFPAAPVAAVLPVSSGARSDSPASTTPK